MSDWITIASDELTAAIDPRGAELSSLTDADGRELMTDADPAFWRGRAPLLFPIVGRLVDDRYRLDGREHALEKHGFARRQHFAVAHRGTDRITFCLTDNDATRAQYPFAFVLEIAFVLDGPTLAMTATVTNPGEAPLPFSFGYHPAFAWPLPFGQPRDAHRIEFAADEPDALRSITPAGLIGPAPRPSPLVDRTLLLADDLFTDDALVWDHVRSRSLIYGAPGAPRLEVAFPDSPALGIWTKPGARYVCIEPWAGHADPQGYAGDFRDKPGAMQLAPGDSRSFRMHVTLTI